MLLVYLKQQLNLLDYGISSLWRKKIKNIGLLAVFAAVIFLFSSYQLLTTGLTHLAANVLQTVPHITVQQLQAGRQVPIGGAATAALEDIFGINSIEGRIWGYYFDEVNGANYTVMGVDFSSMNTTLSATSLASGRFPAENERGKAVISEPVRRNMQLGNRRFFSLFRPDLSMASFETVGLFGAQSAIVTDDLILVTTTDARDLFAIEKHLFTDILVMVSNPAEIDTVAKKISDRLPGVRVVTRDQIRKTYDVVFGWRSGFGLFCLLSSVAAFTILAWDKASGLSAEEKTEVAVLKMLGWQSSDIMAVRFWESLVLALTSFVVGYSLAWLHIGYFNGLLFQPLLLGWSVLQPSYSITPVVSGSDLLLIFSLSVVPYLAATVVPAWRSGLVRPDTVV